jgi:uncharacterized phage protein gp47/JayE
MAIPPTSPVPTIDATGLHLPDFTQVLQYFMLGYQGIYGSDTYLENDSQDGQLIGIFATAVDDLNSAIGAAYNAYSPSTAQGVGLSSVVKINGISRQVSSNSTVDLYIVGVAGTIIENGYAIDLNSNQWTLPTPTVIGPTGDNTVTATCATPGAVRADPDTITAIGTPVLGWQTVTNPASATVGAPVESDAALRARQTQSTMLPSQTILDGIQGELLAILGVQRVRCYENDTDTLRYYNNVSTSFPPHSISCVIDGGNDGDIVDTIGIKKTPGAYTNGTTAVVWTSPYGIPETIRFSRPVETSIAFAITLTSFSGFTTDIQAQIANTIAAWVNSLGIGAIVEWIASLVPAQLYGVMPQAATFEITHLTMGILGQILQQVDIIMAWDHAPTCDPANITFTVVASPTAVVASPTASRRRR